ncbi:MAG TPA: AMP-binding protein [Longimicrobiales bacterium]|nr:AMP-binding protein [Longimicrobiales bacterium]
MHVGMNGVVDLLQAALHEGCDPGAVALIARAGGAMLGPASSTAYALSDLEPLVDARAALLAAEGAEASRILPVCLEPDADGVLTLLALWRLGVTPAPLNPRLTERETAHARAALEGRAGEGAQVVLWTSGTSGRPRGVALSYGALSAHVAAVRRRLGLDPLRDTWLGSLSLAHVGGLMLAFRSILTGSRLVAFGAVTPEETWGLVRGDLLPTGLSTPVTHASLVPTQLKRLLDATGDAAPPPSFRCLLLGGAHTPVDLLARARAAGWPVALTYGMTEMCSQVATATPGQVEAKPGCVGPPLDGVELRIAETEEVLVRGPSLAAGYLDGTPLLDADGWYHTGDLGRLDEAGDLWITGRRSDRIISGGVNVDAAEVEDVLRGHPSVVDACVAGVPDEEWGEVVAAWVVPVEGEFDVDEVDAWLRDRLAGPKRPRRWVVESDLPLNANGKVDRAMVRALLGGS